MRLLLSHLLVAVITVAALFFSGWLVKPGTEKSRVDQPPSQEKKAFAPSTESATTRLTATRSSEQLALENQWLQTLIEQLEQENRELEQKLRAAELARGGRTAQSQNTWFDESALLEAGLKARDFSELQQRVEALELQKLELTNQATREGWVRKKEYYQQMRDMEQGFHESLTPNEYDIYLYATGKPNRVSVSDVLENSAASLGGIQSGDIILQYAGEAVYDPSALYRMTTQGSYGEMVPVTLKRGEEVIISYLPRGPLGTRFRPQRQPPAQP